MVVSLVYSKALFYSSAMLLKASVSLLGVGSTAAVRYLPCRGSHAAIMFCGLNICRVRSDTVWGAVYLRVSLRLVG